MSPQLTECEDLAWYRELSAARGAAAALARRVGLDGQRSGQVALAVSEAASNLAKHAVSDPGIAGHQLRGLLRHPPVVVAGQLLREAGIRHDDADVVVAKGAW